MFRSTVQNVTLFSILSFSFLFGHNAHLRAQDIHLTEENCVDSLSAQSSGVELFDCLLQIVKSNGILSDNLDVLESRMNETIERLEIAAQEASEARDIIISRIQRFEEIERNWSNANLKMNEQLAQFPLSLRDIQAAPGSTFVIDEIFDPDAQDIQENSGWVEEEIDGDWLICTLSRQRIQLGFSVPSNANPNYICDCTVEGQLNSESAQFSWALKMNRHFNIGNERCRCEATCY